MKFCAALSLALTACFTFRPDAKADGVFEALQRSSPAWMEVGSTARKVVSGDETTASLPFRVAPRQDGQRLVFAYYFPFFLASMDNKPIAEDHWTQDYLKRSGESGKYASVGGFARERPLPVGPWPTPNWREIDLSIDVLRAAAIGLNGFTVGIQDVGHGLARAIADNVCNAASNLDLDFHIVAEPDAGVLRSVPASELAKILSTFSTCPATFHDKSGYVLIAPFAAELQPVTYWSQVLQTLNSSGLKARLLPILLDSDRYGEAFSSISQGIGSWGARDPQSITASNALALPSQNRQRPQLAMPAIAPQDSRPKIAAFWESHNTAAFRAAWMAAIHSNAPYAQVLTWNDYSETTEIAPSSGIQYLFYDLTAYYASWFRIGQQPEILRDAIYYCQRDQVFKPLDPPKKGDQRYRQLGQEGVQNDVELIALLQSTAVIEIELNGKVVREVGQKGLNTLTIAASPGRPIFRIIRGGRTAVEKKSDWLIQANPDALSAIYHGGSSTRAFVATTQSP